MNWRTGLVGIGVVLVLLGSASMVRGCSQALAPGESSTAQQNAGERPENTGYAPGRPEAQENKAIWSVLGGLGLAAGAAAIGIGIGRWKRPRAPQSSADYTGPE